MVSDRSIGENLTAVSEPTNEIARISGWSQMKVTALKEETASMKRKSILIVLGICTFVLTMNAIDHTVGKARFFGQFHQHHARTGILFRLAMREFNSLIALWLGVPPLPVSWSSCCHTQQPLGTSEEQTCLMYNVASNSPKVESSPENWMVQC